jgi:hypothetical protein
VLIWETTSTSAKVLGALAARAAGVAECLVREDKTGSFILCERGTAPKGVLEMHLTPLFSGGRFGPGAGPWVFRVGLWTPKDWRSEFFAWYKCEHGPILLECPDWDGYQFFESPSARGCQFYVVHYLADRSALDSEWRRLSRSTPWFRRLAKNKWFDGPFERVLCRRLPLGAAIRKSTTANLA